MQFGQGNFLRSFAENYFQELNLQGKQYSVDIVLPINNGVSPHYAKQNNKYNIVKCGIKSGVKIEEATKITCISSVIDPFKDMQSFYNLASQKDLKVIISNTTEAGIAYNSADKFEDFEGITFPAKLAKFLLHRFKECGTESGDIYILPTELIENNGDVLSQFIKQYISLWELGSDFALWLENSVFICNTLVDRIVSGYPKTAQAVSYYNNLVGGQDKLLAICEPFGLWAIEDKGNLKQYIPQCEAGITVELSSNIDYYKKRKVRLLNGAHTTIALMGLVLGKTTVADCMEDATISKFLADTINKEIIPFVIGDSASTKQFALDVVERFKNPFLNHQLSSISLNTISKWIARVLPSFKDYYYTHNKLAKNLTIGLSYIVYVYKNLVKKDGKYYATLAGKTIEIKDEAQYLSHFENGGDITSLLSFANCFDENCAIFDRLVQEVAQKVDKIAQREILL